MTTTHSPGQATVALTDDTFVRAPRHVLAGLDEDTPTPKTAAFLFAGGLALSGLLSGTGTSTPFAEPLVRFAGAETCTARVVGNISGRGGVGGLGGELGKLRLPLRRPEDADPEQTLPPAPATAGETARATAAAAAHADRATQADELRWLHQTSGLTWEQLGRVFGVSRRAVHLWANGGRMNATNAELLGQMVALVRELPGPTADERRAALLAPTADGTSAIDRFRARNRIDSRDVSGTPFRPEELLGARHDNHGGGAVQT